ATRTGVAEVETARHRHERRDRLLSTGRTQAEVNPALSGSARGIPQPSGHCDEKSSGDSRPGPSWRTGAVGRGGCVYFAHHARYGTAQSGGTPHLATGQPV